MSFERVDVDIVEGGTGVGLTELLLERLELRDLRHRLDRVAVAEWLAASAHLHRPATETRTEGAQVVGQLRHLTGQVGVGQCLAHQLAELLALGGGEGRQHAVRCGLPAGQRVDQLVDVLRLVGEEVAVLVHEPPELVRCVVATGMRREQRVEVGEHVLDRIHRSRVRR